MALPAARHLLRHWKSFPLLKLNQGSSLSIRSTLPQATNILIQSGWRDEGHVEFKQVLAKDSQDDELCEMAVTHETDKNTSLGRSAGHISLLLHAPPPAAAPSEEGRSRYMDATRGIITPLDSTRSTVKYMLDDGAVVADSPDSDRLRRVDYHDGIAHLTPKEDDHTERPGINLIVKVPEKINLDVSLLEGGGTISVQGKVEGDCSLATAHGGIAVEKLRGHSISLAASKTIYAKDLLEAQNLMINTSGRLRAKQIHGRSIRMVVDKLQPEDEDADKIAPQDVDDEGSTIDIGSLFISGDGGATILIEGSDYQPQKRAVRVKSHHGPLQVVTTGMRQPRDSQSLRGDKQFYPLVELGGINGSCQISIDSTSASVHDADSWVSCQCHVDSLSSDSVSLLSVDAGNIHLTLDRKVETDTRLASLASNVCIDEVAALLADEENEDLLEQVLRNLHDDAGSTLSGATNHNNPIAIDTKAYTAQSSLHTETLCYNSGWLENRSNEPDSRFELNRLGSVGKIRTDTAAHHALHSFSAESSSDEADNGRPLLAAVTSGRIVVETVSWIGAIARRYGLVEDGRELGRTSGRHGRRLVPHENE